MTTDGGHGRAERAAAGVGAVGRLDHVAVAVRDADAAAATFVALLGHVVEHDEVVAGVGVRLVHLAAPVADAATAPAATTLQLVQPVAPGPTADFLAEHGEGMHHVCFVTDDIAATAARGAGAPEVFTGGRGRPCAFLDSQPHGVRVELVQHAPGPLGSGGGADSADAGTRRTP